LLDRFEAERPRLRALAYRMHGSSAEAIRHLTAAGMPR
jgi:hypothetical protein